MPHVPHLFIRPPWSGDRHDLGTASINHLFKSLRLDPGSTITYTDGQGRIGTGELAAAHLVRGEERSVPPPIDLEIAVAPPHERDRIRFLVEKAAEHEVRTLRWLRTRFGNTRPAQVSRANDWAISALEQSRGAWLTVVESEWVALSDLEDDRTTLLADPAGSEAPEAAPPLRVVVGPEGGWAEGEIPDDWPRLSLGRNILRTETAVSAAAVWVSSHSTNFPGD